MNRLFTDGDFGFSTWWIIGSLSFNLFSFSSKNMRLQRSTCPVVSCLRTSELDNGLVWQADGWQKLSAPLPTTIFGYIPVLPFCPLIRELHFSYLMKKECKHG